MTVADFKIHQLNTIGNFWYYFARNRGGVRYSVSKGAYIWNSNGREVSDAKLQNELSRNVEFYHDNVDKLAKRLDDGNLTVGQWQDRMRTEIKNIHRTQYATGRGGWDSMTPRDWGRLGSDLRWQQYKALDGFALDIADGKLSLAQISARSKLYMNASNKQYWRGKVEAKLQAGYIEKARFLNPAEHCEDCEGFAARGRVPIDDASLPPPGEESVCQANCKCTMKFYKAGE